MAHSKTSTTYSNRVASTLMIAFDIFVDNLYLIMCDPLSLVLISCYYSLTFFDLVWFVWIEKDIPIRTSVCLRGRSPEKCQNTHREANRVMIGQCLDSLFWARYRQAQCSTLSHALHSSTSPSLDSLLFTSLLIIYCPEAKNSQKSLLFPSIKNQSSIRTYLLSECLCPSKTHLLKF